MLTLKHEKKDIQRETKKMKIKEKHWQREASA
jgi:hypothetical protein